MIPMETLPLCIRAKKHSFVRHLNAGNGTPVKTLLFLDEEPTKEDTSTIRYPKKHDHYSRAPTTPWATNCMQYLLLKKNINDIAQIVHLFVFVNRLQL